MRALPAMRLSLCVSFLVGALLLVSCAPPPEAEGKYQAQGQDGKTVTLTLKVGSTGEWSTDTDAVPLRWETRSGDIWLHSKSGGVLRGVWDNGALRVNLPGEGDLLFRRSGASP